MLDYLFGSVSANPSSEEARAHTEPSSKITASGCGLEEELFVLLRAHLYRHLPAERIVGAAIKFFNIAVGRHNSSMVRDDREL